MAYASPQQQLIFHFVMTVYCAWLSTYSLSLLKENKKILDPEGRIPSFGGRWKYLTDINRELQLLFFGLHFITDVINFLSTSRGRRQTSTTQTAANWMLDIFFTSVLFPLSWFIVFTFWVIYMYDGSLIYGANNDKVIPWWLNHLWHTAIGFITLIELLLVKHQFSETIKRIIIVATYNIVYITWIGAVYLCADQFAVYPIMAVSPFRMLLLFFTICILISIGIFWIGKHIFGYR